MRFLNWFRQSRRVASGASAALARDGGRVVGAEALQLFGIKTHAEGEPHPSQDGLDLVQRLLAEVLGLEELGLRLLNQVPDGPDVGGLQAVRGPYRQLQVVHAPEQVL